MMKALRYLGRVSASAGEADGPRSILFKFVRLRLASHTPFQAAQRSDGSTYLIQRRCGVENLTSASQSIARMCGRVTPGIRADVSCQALRRAVLFRHTEPRP